MPKCIAPKDSAEIRCQIGVADWLINTITTFGGSLATAHKCVGVWLADPSVSPVEETR